MYLPGKTIVITVGLIALALSSAYGAEDCVRASRMVEEAAGLVETDLSGAMRKIYKAIELCDASAALRYNLAVLYRKQSRLAEAERVLRSAIHRNPRFAQAYHLLAINEMDKPDGDQSIAVGYATRAVSIDPDNAGYQATLAFAKNPSYSPILSLDIAVEDENRDLMVVGGESATLIVRVRNTGKGAARSVDVVAALEAPMPGLTILDEKASVAELPPKSERIVRLAIATDEAELPTSRASFVVRAFDRNGNAVEPLRAGISTAAFAPPVLEITSLRIDDMNGNGRIEPAEMVDIVVRVENTGTNPARKVRARMNLGKVVFMAPDSLAEFELGDMPPGSHEDVTFRIYTAPDASEIPASISLIEERPKFGMVWPLDLTLDHGGP